MAGLSDDETPIYDCRYKNYGAQVAVERGSVHLHIREMRSVRYTQWVPASSGRDVPPKPYNRNFMCEGISLNLAELRDLLEAMDEATEALANMQPYIAFIGERGRRLQVDSWKNVWVISIHSWFRPHGAVKLIPTKVGVTFNKDAWGRFVSFMDLLEEDLERNSEALIGLMEYLRCKDMEMEARRVNIRAPKAAAPYGVLPVVTTPGDEPVLKVVRAASSDSADIYI